MSRGIRFLALALLLAGPGCPQPTDDDAADDDVADDDAVDDDDGGDDDGGDDDDAGLDACTFADPAPAQLQVTEQYRAQAWRADIDGRVHEAPPPVWQSVVLEGGECRYLMLFPGFCDPPCEWGEFCNPDGECEAYPAGVSAGDLTVEGLGDPLTIEEEPQLAGRYSGGDSLPPDLFAAGDPIAASWAGDTFPAVTLDARGVAPMDTDLAETWLVLVGGEDHVVSWTPGDDPEACVELRVNGYNSAHGLPLNNIIWCVGPDDGELTIPGAMVALFPMGTCPIVAVDCPPSELTRYTRQTRETAGGEAALVVRSTTAFAWEHLAAE